MHVIPAVLAVVLSLSVTAKAEEWTQVESANPAFTMGYSKSSIEPVSSTIKRARTRFISNNNDPIPGVEVYSVVSELEYHCTQPLEKLLWVEIKPNAEAASFQAKAESPVFSEIRHGSNSYRLWLEVCSRLKPQPQ